MDVYGGLSVDDLLDLPTDDFLSSDCLHSGHRPSSSTHSHSHQPHATAFNDILFVPAEDAAELEWLSNYMDDSFDDYPANSLTAASATFHSINPASIRGDEEGEGENLANPERGEAARRCTHCASEKTPQWRTGPLGPKTLCNACGVRYKSGRLVPEYRPAASPTFVLTQHSNSHRKVLELRRQKEMLHQQQQRRRTDVIFGCADVRPVCVTTAPSLFNVYD